MWLGSWAALALAVTAQTTFVVVGLVFASSGAILWLGAFTLAQPDKDRVREIANGLAVLSPVFLAWPLLEEVGSIAQGATLAFFAGFLILVFIGRFAKPLARRLLLPFCSGLPGDKSEGQTTYGNDCQENKQRKPDTKSCEGNHPPTIGTRVKPPTGFLLAGAFAAGALIGRLLTRRARY